MPETLHQSEVDSKTDPSVSKQYDDETPKDKQVQQFYEMVDGKKIGILNTYRNGIGSYSISYTTRRKPTKATVPHLIDHF
jgi:hypothetical protein